MYGRRKGIDRNTILRNQLPCNRTSIFPVQDEYRGMKNGHCLRIPLYITSHSSSGAVFRDGVETPMSGIWPQRESCRGNKDLIPRPTTISETNQEVYSGAIQFSPKAKVILCPTHSDPWTLLSSLIRKAPYSRKSVASEFGLRSNV